MSSSYFFNHEENLESADLLISTHKKFNSSVHCSYYAVYQLIMHIHKIKKYNPNRNRDPLSFSGSHDRTINFTFEEIRKLDRGAATVFNRNIQTLKNNRHSADYSEMEIDKAFSGVCLSTARILCQSLIDTFLSQNT